MPFDSPFKSCYLPPVDVVSEDLKEDSAAQENGTGQTHLPQDGVCVGHKPGGKKAQGHRGQPTKVDERSEEGVKSLQSDEPDLERQDLRIELDDASGGLNEDESGEKDSQDGVIACVVGGVVEDLVGGDDHHTCEGGSQCAALQNPVPSHLGRPLSQLRNGRGPRGEEQDGFRHEHCVLHAKDAHIIQVMASKTMHTHAHIFLNLLLVTSVLGAKRKDLKVCACACVHVCEWEWLVSDLKNLLLDGLASHMTEVAKTKIRTWGTKPSNNESLLRRGLFSGSAGTGFFYTQ